MHQSFLSRALLLALPLLVGCRDAARSSSATPAPPAAEFVLAAGDSAFWLTSDSAGIRFRGAPLELARYGGRFFELYVVDDDHSFLGADLVGQSVYRRDLRTGDSVIVFTDSLLPQLAREYASKHPDDHPLEPDEEPDDDPELRATATIDLGAAHGPFVSYSLHTDVERDREPLWHTSRRGVLDLRTGRAATLADVAGPQAKVVERDVRALGVPPHHAFDARSFAITTLDGAPAIAYAFPGAGEGDDGHLFPLTPIRIADPIWWRDVAVTLPTTFAEGSREVWRHNGYAVVVRYDSTGDATLAIRDSTSREWKVGHVSGPATRIYWLDGPAVDGDTRHALARAFTEAAGYGADSRVAVNVGKRRLFLASRPSPSH
ncbi:MAG: hypothetical protein JWL61_1580 [Gemmatimonadetes bacterium]|nr:hypothetical protein [Gemmatimonadota bacterium]